METTIKCPVCGATCELPNEVIVFAHVNSTSYSIKIPKSNGYYCKRCKEGHITTEMINEFSSEIKNGIKRNSLIGFISLGNEKYGVIYYEYK